MVEVGKLIRKKIQIIFYFTILILLISGCGNFFKQVNNSKEDILPKIKNFPFEFSIVFPDKTKLENERYNIKIINKDNNKVQIIEEGTPLKNADISDLLEVKDFNNDGYLDILAFSIYPSLQLVTTLYIFNPETQYFTNRMDNIPYEGTISVTKPGCIKIEYIVRNSSDYLEPQKFCWIDNSWQPE
ncbi:hypothetical protein PL75_04800 [Neisseria arctica]|uniref:Lipoprotein n=1 Tax=Neisseria arctica TaxID=1470200 RepID=A0A0J0YSA8_9NEIS|nr:hypothetical protein [Neisseria arctica]KLT73001.1 hypothetical protein PL75_04800 [Neisseria arctica]UOO86715.1 hypothetical protein LVJ86_00190 [Neisseria arctica]